MTTLTGESASMTAARSAARCPDVRRTIACRRITDPIPHSASGSRMLNELKRQRGRSLQLSPRWTLSVLSGARPVEAPRVAADAETRLRPQRLGRAEPRRFGRGIQTGEGADQEPGARRGDERVEGHDERLVPAPNSRPATPPIAARSADSQRNWAVM